MLLFNFNTSSNVIIIDSSCFNGIDPRQVSGLLSSLQSICKSQNKQAIISINKYQVTNEFVDNYESGMLELSEDNKLLKFSY